MSKLVSKLRRRVTEIKTLTLVLDCITTERLVVTTARALTSNGIRESRNTIPSLRSGYGAVQPHGEGLVQIGVQGSERSLVIGRQRAEWSGRAAARRGARAANRDDRLSALFPCVVVISGLVVVTALVALLGVLVAGVRGPVALWESGGNTGQGNGDDKRDNGFVEQHYNECMKGDFIFSVCLVG